MAEDFEFAYDFEQEGPERLDKIVLSFLQENAEYKQITRSQLKHWFEQGCIAVDGVLVRKPGTAIKSEVTLQVTAPEPRATTLEPYEFALDLVYEDEFLLVVNKPAGLAVHPGAGQHSNTLVNALLYHCGEELLAAGGGARPGIVHRLDKDTTGLLVVAKQVAVLAGLQQQFMERSVTRAYQALALTSPRGKNEIGIADQGVIDKPIGRDPRYRQRMAVVDSGRRAVTHWRVEERMRYACLLEVRLETGRTHQIRVHLSSIHAPIIGDQSYGNFQSLPKDLDAAATRFGRQALHAFRLGFFHPIRGEQLSFEVPAPGDMQELVSVFREYK